MTFSIRTVTLLVLIAVIVTAGVSHYYYPLTKTIEVEREVIKNNIVTVTHTVKEKDGRVDIITTTTDKSQKIESNTKTKSINLQTNWLVSGLYETDIHALQPTYGLQVNRRILGPVFISAVLNTKGSVGLGLGFEF